MAESQNAIDYKKKLVAAVSRLQEEEDKYKEEFDSLKDRMQQAGSRMQTQFERVRVQLTLLNKEDKTADSHSEKKATAWGSSSATGIRTSSSTVPSSVSTKVIVDSDKMLKELTTALGDLHREERLVLTEMLIKELKKMRAEDKKAEKATRDATLQQQTKMKTEVVVEEKPQLLLNGEITAAVQQGTELKACDSMLTIQMVKDASVSTTPTTSTAPATSTAVAP